MKLLTERLVLRSLQPRDAGSLAAQANNLNVSQYLLLVKYPYNLRDARTFIASCRKKAQKRAGEEYNFGIQQKGKPGIIGMISLSKIDRSQGTAEIGYWLGELFWRQGIMSEALKSILDFAFLTKKLRRIDIAAFVENAASNALIRKMGFRYEGLRKEKARAKSTGKVHDEYVYGMLKREWMKKRSRV